MIDLKQASKHIELLTGVKNSEIHFQIFSDKKVNKGVPAHFFGSLGASIKRLNQAQSNDMGVFLCINQTNGASRRNDAIEAFRTFVIDFDNVVRPEFKLEPSFINSRSEVNSHVYFTLVDNELTGKQWTHVQKELAKIYGGDEKICDPARVMRLAGSKHLKDEAQDYTIIQESGKRYTVAEVIEAHNITLVSSTPSKVSVLPQGVDAPLNTDADIKAFTSYLKSRSPLKEGQGGDVGLYKIACTARDIGLSMDTASKLAWEIFNPRCLPPWDDFNEFNRKFINAEKYGKNESGSKSVTLLKEVEVSRTTVQEGQNLRFTFDNKTCVNDIAKAYDGIYHEGKNITCIDGVFYTYNGKYWSEKTISDLSSHIMYAFPELKFDSKKVNNVLSTLAMLVNGGSDLLEKRQSNLIHFNNGVLDMNNLELGLQEHSYTRFNTSVLSHDYNEIAQCELWLSTLNNIFDYDLSLVDMLQEWYGYCLTTDLSQEKMAVFVGKSRSGKSTINEMLIDLIGREHTTSPQLAKLAENSTLESMVNKSLITIPECETLPSTVQSSVLSILKSIVGKDNLSFHKMYKGTRTTRFMTKVTFTTNKMPEFNDPSAALANRMLVFPFENSYAGKENRKLKELLNIEIEGVAMWALEGLKRLRQNGGFTKSKYSEEYTENFKSKFDVLSYFYDCNCEEVEGHTEDLVDAFKIYIRHCGETGTRPMSMPKFEQAISNGMNSFMVIKGARGKRTINNMRLRVL